VEVILIQVVVSSIVLVIFLGVEQLIVDRVLLHIHQVLFLVVQAALLKQEHVITEC